MARITSHSFALPKYSSVTSQQPKRSCRTHSWPCYGAWSRLRDPAKARAYLQQSVVNDTFANDSALVRRINIPALLAVAPDDQYCSIPAMRGYYAKIPAPVKRLMIETKYPGTHGWDLLTGPTGQPSPLATTVAQWVLGHTDR